MTELEGLILFWKSVLKGAWFLLEPSVKLHIEHTIIWLELLRSEGKRAP